MPRGRRCRRGQRGAGYRRGSNRRCGRVGCYRSGARSRRLTASAARSGQSEGEDQVVVAKQQVERFAEQEPEPDAATAAGGDVGRVRVPEQRSQQCGPGVAGQVEQCPRVPVAAQRLVGGLAGAGLHQRPADVLDRGPCGVGGPVEQAQHRDGVLGRRSSGHARLRRPESVARLRFEVAGT